MRPAEIIVADHQTVIALWLGHESVETTQIYLHADMHMKERALGHVDPRGAAPGSAGPKLTHLATPKLTHPVE